ncbi:S-adenosyl-L-methionine:benzoic acid/salicylic acid carboxyl methyltransferase 3-like [Rutidosis leptorrhynchoides]|uniref:S-adenosyl-L-methionine:benzoic acid/salicylic acid carboxyl methyltransferase 3-like n=1 Tax=Rutidosis leptorrhynchoides TaxID=125765 RepID=UPI003A99FE49
MSLENVLHMNTGDGESSYANNSSLQATVILKALPILKHTIKHIVDDDIVHGCFNIGDLGCGSGENAFLVVTNIINIVYETCRENNLKAPQFHVCLNDLFGNDFNALFKCLQDFYANLKEKEETFGSCFVSATPGSFYNRLFPDQSLHLVYSSYGVHWLSQVPKGIENNKFNICMAKKSPPNVFQAYGKQFHSDFTKFLQMRSEEIVPGGHMVLTFMGRSKPDPTSDDCCMLFEQLAIALSDMLKEGLVQESEINSFNIRIYFPCVDEVRDAIQIEGSFSLDTLNVFEVDWDPCDEDYTYTKDLNDLNHSHGINASKMMRAGLEPLLKLHFESSNMNLMFKKCAENMAKYLAIKKTRLFSIAISLTKK